MTTVGTSSPLRFKAQKAIKAMVASGKLSPGTPVVERDLARQLGLSRTPVREALAELAREGVIRSVGSRARIVAEPTLKDVVELYDLREMVEGMAARLLVPLASDELLAELRDLAEGLDSDKLGVPEDFHFHELMVRNCGNSRLLRIADAVHIQWATFRLGEAMIQRGVLPRGSNASLKAPHREIVAALTSRDPDRAEHAARDHIVELKQSVLPNLR